MARRPRRSHSGNDTPVIGDERTVDGDGKQIGDGASADAGRTTINPAAIGNDTGSGDDGGSGTEQPRAKRAYRARGSKTPLDLGDFADILIMAHAGFATALNAPNINLTDDEAKRIADATQRVARHYNFPGMAVQTKDWIGLIVALGSVYGPRVTAAFVNRNVKPDVTEPLTVEQSNVVQHPGMNR